MQTAYKRIRLRDVRKEFVEQTRLRISFERSITRNLINYFSKIGKDSKEIFESNGTVGVNTYLTKTRTSLEETLRPFYFQIIKTFSEQSDKYLAKKLEDDYYNRILELFITRIGARHITNIDETTRKQMKKVILESQKEGLSVLETAIAIENRFKPRFTRARANTIARTETHSASTFANHELGKVYAQTGITLKKRWVATMDDRTRVEHREANGKTVPMEEDFIVGGVPMEYAGDPRGGAKNVINCRCAVIYVEDDEEIIQ